MLTAGRRRAQATPTPRRAAERALRQTRERAGRGAAGLCVAALALFGQRIPAAAAALYGPRGLRLLLNVATALLVVSLPIAASTASNPTPAREASPALASVSTVADEDGGSTRAATVSRGLVAGSRSVVTVASEDVRPVVRYAVKNGDTLSQIADRFQIPTDDLAYANGIEDEGTTLHVGQTLTVPPGRGALYVVKNGDTVAGVAEKFKVDPSVIMTYNRLYFEPEHFAPDQLIFVPGAEVPAMKRVTISRTYTPAGQLPERTGRLSWPVNGVITQYFWWGHTGVDIAAPYGTTIVSSDDGVVVATGWVAVGGLRVCVEHSGGLQTCYYHTSAVFVSPGQTVKRGQALAAIGMTGVTTGPHVHWEVKLNGVAVNPLAY
ncbi:MAG TPA: peptidoglycan DD-metalloendopeptidase family protein [Candidatus Limnocylindria bacterium]|nr:peptidoglycan DD-metalloendopeptidase family protein [Candidatus Limnocylindria bacterium]